MVWLNSPTAYSFVMISPNLHAIWAFLLMNLSQDLKCFLLIYFGTLGDGYSLKGSNKKPSRHRNDLGNSKATPTKGPSDAQKKLLPLLHCKENPIYVFLFWELRGLNPNFHIHVSVCHLYIPRIGPHISCNRIGRSMMGIYKSLTDT